MNFELVAIPLDEANAFVAQLHRHHKPVVGHRFSIGCVQDGRVVGVAIVGRPVASGWNHQTTCEVTRVCTDGTPNACSFLYSRCKRAAEALGYLRLITYTLKSESGASLRASNWIVLHEVKGRSWSCDSRPRVDKHPLEDKLCWTPDDYRPARAVS